MTFPKQNLHIWLNITSVSTISTSERSVCDCSQTGIVCYFFSRENKETEEVALNTHGGKEKSIRWIKKEITIAHVFPLLVQMQSQCSDQK